MAECFVSVAAREPRKQRADHQFLGHASQVSHERFFIFELERTLVDDGSTADEQLDAFQAAAKDFLDGHRTFVRRCVLTLMGKQHA